MSKEMNKEWKRAADESEGFGKYTQGLFDILEPLETEAERREAATSYITNTVVPEVLSGGLQHALKGLKHFVRENSGNRNMLEDGIKHGVKEKKDK